MIDATPTVTPKSAAICGSSESAERTIAWLAKPATARNAMARVGDLSGGAVGEGKEGLLTVERQYSRRRAGPPGAGIVVGGRKRYGIICQSRYMSFRKVDGARMPTRNVVLTKHQEKLIKSLVDSGRYQNASEVLREGLRLMEQREAEEAAKLQALREAARLGFDALDRGEFKEFDDIEELTAHLNRLSDKLVSK
jgi:antitoxin ParD1/3/4